MAKFLPLSAAVEEVVRDGDKVAFEGFTHLIPYAAGHEAIRQRRKDLTLVRMTPDLLYDQIIGMGGARKMVFSWGGNPGVGSLHRFREAYEQGWPKPLEIEEHSHAALANAFEAGAAGLPFGVREVFSPTVADAGMPGPHIRIEGRVIDGEGNVLPDALVEIWQADQDGRYAHPADGRPLKSNSFRGFGRCPTAKDGSFRFETVKPGAVPGPNGTTQAPHINVSILARGILKRLFTRIYFAGDPANASDPILALVPADRRQALMARPQGGTGVFRFDIRIQGSDETVFFDA